MTAQVETEVVVLGSGPGGYSAAFRAADCKSDKSEGVKCDMYDFGPKPDLYPGSDSGGQMPDLFSDGAWEYMRQYEATKALCNNDSSCMGVQLGTKDLGDAQYAYRYARCKFPGSTQLGTGLRQATFLDDQKGERTR